MKYLDRFFGYIKESKDFDLNEISDLLLPISDLGIRISYNETILTSSGEYNSHNCLLISFSFSTIKDSEFIINGIKSSYINDSIFWDFMDEILSFKKRTDVLSNNCIVKFGTTYDDSRYFTIVLIGDKQNSNMSLFNLSEIIKSKLVNMRTDFAYSTVVRLVDGNLIIKTDTDDYTDRKFNNLVGSDIKNFDVEKKVHGRETINKITLKK